MTKRNWFNLPFFFKKKRRKLQEGSLQDSSSSSSMLSPIMCAVKRNEMKRNEALDGAMGLIET